MRIRERVTRVVIAAAALALGGMGPVASSAQDSQPPTPSTPTNQLASVTLARGIKAVPFFGEGPVTPVDPATNFINTDLPYAIVTVKSLVPGTAVTLRVVDPTGPEIVVEVKAPPRKAAWDGFDFALPVYILGTDMEGHVGTWHFQVSFDGRLQNDTTFEWQRATPLALWRIKDLVDQSPSNADLHWRYGAALALLGHDREAMEELQNAIHLDGRYALYHITLGRLYEREGRQADAIRAFQAAIAIHGSYYDAIFSGWAQAHLAHLHAP